MPQLHPTDDHAAADLAERARRLICHPLTPARVRHEAVRKLAARFGYELVEPAVNLDDVAAELGVEL